MAGVQGGKDYGLILTWIGTLAFGAVVVYVMSLLLA